MNGCIFISDMFVEPALISQACRKTNSSSYDLPFYYLDLCCDISEILHCVQYNFSAISSVMKAADKILVVICFGKIDNYAKENWEIVCNRVYNVINLLESFNLDIIIYSKEKIKMQECHIIENEEKLYGSIICFIQDFFEGKK